MAHRDRAHIDLCKLLPHLVEQLAIDLILKIAEHHIRARAVRHLVAFQRKLRVADAAAQQCRVCYKRFDESIVRAAQHLTRRRLLYAAGRKLLCVDQRARVKSVDEQQQFPQKYARHRGFDALLGIHLAEGDVSVDELLHRLRAVDVSERQPETQHPLNDCVIAVTVHDPQPRAFPADVQIARDHIKAAPHAKQGVQCTHIFLKIRRQAIHSRPPAIRFSFIMDRGEKIMPPDAAFSPHHAGAEHKKGSSLFIESFLFCAYRRGVSLTLPY